MSSKIRPKKAANPQVTENVILLKYLYLSRKRPVKIANIAPRISNAAKVLVEITPSPSPPGFERNLLKRSLLLQDRLPALLR